MIHRNQELTTLTHLLRQFPVVGLIGARQVGKTTLARTFQKKRKGPSTYFDLENPEDLARLQDPFLTLKPLKGLVIIDEVQRKPDIFNSLRVLADRKPIGAKFLVLGSASPVLLKQSAETLAGRIAYHELTGFTLKEISPKDMNKLWARGGFPDSFLAHTNTDSLRWRQQFIQTFLERDIPQLGINVSSDTLRRFWIMLAHYHGQILNTSELGRSLGVSDTAIRHYLDILSSSLVLKQLTPWHENISKRQIKSPKVFVADSGLLHALLNLPSLHDIEAHPKLGASWEGFLIAQLIQILKVKWNECYFWGTHAGAELDFLVIRGKNRWGFEIKRTSSPRLTPSMKSALENLRLTRLDVIHGGEKSFSLGPKTKAISIEHLQSEIRSL